MNDTNQKWQQIVTRIPKAHKAIFLGSKAEIANRGLIITLTDSGVDMTKVEQITAKYISAKVSKIFGAETKINYQKPLPTIPQPEPEPDRIRIVDRRKKQPFFMVENLLFRSGHAARMKPAALSIYLALVMHSDADNKCWPSYKTLAKLTGQSKRSAQSHIKRLQEFGYIEIEHNFNSNGDNMSNTFFILELPNIGSN